MTSIADGSVCIQTSSESAPVTPSWFGEVVRLPAHLRKHGVFSKIDSAGALCAATLRQGVRQKRPCRSRLRYKDEL
jgi:hypothetical protein